MAWWPRQTPRSGMAFDSAAAIISIVRPAFSGRPGRDQDRVGAPLHDLLRVEPVVARDDDIRIELPHRLHEVVGEGIVVVDEKNHDDFGFWIFDFGLAKPYRAQSRAVSMARKRAAAFDSASRYSRSGIESATIPAPAWIRQRPRSTTAVRMAMAMSRLPAASRYPTAPP